MELATIINSQEQMFFISRACHQERRNQEETFRLNRFPQRFQDKNLKLLLDFQLNFFNLFRFSSKKWVENATKEKFIAANKKQQREHWKEIIFPRKLHPEYEMRSRRFVVFTWKTLCGCKWNVNCSFIWQLKRSNGKTVGGIRQFFLHEVSKANWSL